MVYYATQIRDVTLEFGCLPANLVSLYVDDEPVFSPMDFSDVYSSPRNFETGVGEIADRDFACNLDNQPGHFRSDTWATTVLTNSL